MKNFCLNQLEIKSQIGFTFIELILYVALIFLVFGSLTTTGILTIEDQQKSSVQMEVGASGRYISERIKKEIREARGIGSVTGTSLSLQSFITANDPTIIDLSGNNIRIKLGAAAVVNLNPPGTRITNLHFSNNSSGSASKNVAFEFTVASATTSASQIYNASMTVKGDAEIRSN